MFDAPVGRCTGMFDVPVGCCSAATGAALPLPLALDCVSDPFFGSPIAFAQCAMFPGSDSPMTLPI